MKQEAEKLIDQCWAMLNRKYEEVYVVKNYGYSKPQFRFILSPEQIHLLKSYIAHLPTSQQIFIRIDINMMFGHEIQVQRQTPYIEAIG